MKNYHKNIKIEEMPDSLRDIYTDGTWKWHDNADGTSSLWCVREGSDPWMRRILTITGPITPGDKELIRLAPAMFSRMRVLIAEVAWLRSVLSGVKATLEMAVPIDGAEAASEALIYEAIGMIDEIIKT